MIIGFGIAGSAIFAPILGTSSTVTSGYQFVVGLMIFLFGLAIGLLGNIATFFEISAEFNADEVESRLETQEEPIPAK